MSIDDQFSEFARERRTFGPRRGQLQGPVGGPPCPVCGSRNTAVIDSRPMEGGQKRRRKCLENDKCGRFNTFETTIDPADFKKPDVSTLDKSRIIQIVKMAEALKQSLAPKGK